MVIKTTILFNNPSTPSMGTLNRATIFIALRACTGLMTAFTLSVVHHLIWVYMQYTLYGHYMGPLEKNGNLIVTSSLERWRVVVAPTMGRRRYPPELKVERNNYRWWVGGLGPMVAVPAARPSTNRRAATAHDICMRAARTPPPLKYTRTGKLQERQIHTRCLPPTARRGVRHAHGLLQLHSRNVQRYLSIHDYFYRPTTTSSS